MLPGHRNWDCSARQTGVSGPSVLMYDPGRDRRFRRPERHFGLAAKVGLSLAAAVGRVSTSQADREPANAGDRCLFRVGGRCDPTKIDVKPTARRPPQQPVREPSPPFAGSLPLSSSPPPSPETFFTAFLATAFFVVAFAGAAFFLAAFFAVDFFATAGARLHCRRPLCRPPFLEGGNDCRLTSGTESPFALPPGASDRAAGCDGGSDGLLDSAHRFRCASPMRFRAAALSFRRLPLGTSGGVAASE